MDDTPNKNDPQADIAFIIEELLSMFDDAEDGEYKVELRSSRGSRFHARVLNAGRHLGLA